MAESKNKRRIAIACQGGGAHAAFTAGALDPLLNFFCEHQDKYELVGLSGTSGGAICAYLTWCALSQEDNGGKVLEEASVAKAIHTLHEFWTVDNSAYWKARDVNKPFMELLTNSSFTDLFAKGPLALSNMGKAATDSFWDVFTNNSAAVANLWRAGGAAAFGIDFGAQFNPYDWHWSYWARHWRDRLKEMIEKRSEGNQPNRDLKLFVGAVNALTGEFWVFKSHKKKQDKGGVVFNEDEMDQISVDAVLASAAIPFIFEATRTGEAVYWDLSDQCTRLDKGVYWDGLYSQNPPIRELAGLNPDEIWIIQIDPEEKSEEPETTPKIEDRRNELSGNTSLNQELSFVRRTNEFVEQLGKWENHDTSIPRKVLDVSFQRRINELVNRLGKREDGGTEILSELRAVLDAAGENEGEETHVITKVRRIELTIDVDYQSKMDRTPSNIQRLMGHGKDQAELFLKVIPAQIAFEETWEKALRDKEERGEIDVAAVMDFFVEKPTIELVPPVDASSGLSQTEGRKAEEGAGKVRTVLEWCLESNFTIEQSRDYCEVDAPDNERMFSCWVLATADGFDEPIKGRAKVVVQDGKVKRFSFYPLKLKVMEKLKEELDRLDKETLSS